jgi:hypothetical protein
MRTSVWLMNSLTLVLLLVASFRNTDSAITNSMRTNTAEKYKREQLDKLPYPKPLFRMNLTRSEDYAVEHRTFRRLRAGGTRDGDLAEVDSTTSSVAPLFEGMGTHYSFIWVGTPPQRVSVIMDTGSHHTAFPCKGCKCGTHVRDFFFFPLRA